MRITVQRDEARLFTISLFSMPGSVVGHNPVASLRLHLRPTLVGIVLFHTF